ncbi:hypothetical protein [Sporosarcina sp. Marseille-Q4063]|nr:hypothetical protein [Sporosarcina sp. Marseille-Q4063]
MSVFETLMFAVTFAALVVAIRKDEVQSFPCHVTIKNNPSLS